MKKQIRLLNRYINDNHGMLIFCLLSVLIIFLGIHNSFIQDDAFISFRYAHNLATGYGLDWNISTPEHVEGYTNFLWVLLISITEYLGFDPVLSSKIMGIVFSLGTLFFTYKLSLILLKSEFFSLLTIVFLGTNYSFSSYMTGGLETQLQVFLVVSSAFYTFYSIENKKLSNIFTLVLLSLLFTLSVLTRLDTVLISGILYIWLLLSIFVQPSPNSKKVKEFSFLTLPGLIIVTTWLIAKYIYYGDILPNTFYVKAAGLSIGSLEYGLIYLMAFVSGYYLVLMPFIAIYFAKDLISDNKIRILLIIITVWFLYIIKVGGDFMEYRFMIPVLPFIFIVFSKLIHLINKIILQAILIIMILYGSYHHAYAFTGVNGIESIKSLNDHIVAEKQDWKGVGIALGRVFEKSTHNNITIAVTAAGAIPYYSNLKTIDMLGLNDKWIAKHGAIIGSRPGHTHYTSLEYLLKQKVNLVIGHPKVVPLSAKPTLNPQEYFWQTIDESLLPQKTKVVEIPLNKKFKVQILYMIQHPLIEKSIKEFNLTTYEIIRNKK